MASELHTLIEEELKNKHYKGSDEEKALMGALRVEARVKEHQHQKKILTLKRSICVGGGLLVVIVLWVVLALKSKSAPKNFTGGTQSVLMQPTPPQPTPPQPTPPQPTPPQPMPPSSNETIPQTNATKQPMDDTQEGLMTGDYTYTYPNETQTNSETDKNKVLNSSPDSSSAESKGSEVASPPAPTPPANGTNNATTDSSKQDENPNAGSNSGNDNGDYKGDGDNGANDVGRGDDDPDNASPPEGGHRRLV
ncbi:hypothetical protein VOLCADRAFT_116383 [Volvox carteri f. nagariensis]|uniref:Uncharacterized protein n=1 Tax=Volvox carteri f. nagariensis TaxID=3068 RepID=D8TLR8_VOLCA|nr:uncharacterized protein VOLCADRAFT_116383 [Volvox carteri f. nagariensis]EFJ51378.1 hypothetical protein VOLCADRAFT_116383 [Volvox carteri f. nagariensis]|eukprot:XP_002947330.1 hypothetical protein VOLCADRAFT_116383 [Volvox carteri f. nagariensis]